MYFVFVNFILLFFYLFFISHCFVFVISWTTLSYILITFLFQFSMVYVQVFHMDDKRRVALEWELIFPLLLSSASILFSLSELTPSSGSNSKN